MPCTFSCMYTVKIMGPPVVMVRNKPHLKALGMPHNTIFLKNPSPFHKYVALSLTTCFLQDRLGTNLQVKYRLKETICAVGEGTWQECEFSREPVSIYLLFKIDIPVCIMYLCKLRWKMQKERQENRCGNI